MSWSDDVEERLTELRGAARLTKGKPDDDGFASGPGKYLLLHYELMAEDRTDKDLDRSAVYDAVNGVTRKLRAVELTGSVDLLPIPRDRSSEKYAAQLWNALAKALEDLLQAGDSFYLHYSGRGIDQIGLIAQVVPESQRSLSRVEIPEA